MSYSLNTDLFLLPTPAGAFNAVAGSANNRLARFLVELLRNAARFAPDGRITLAYTLISHKKRIAFTVTDRGPGIPTAEAGRIFDRFVKLAPFSQGMGLGLAVCRLIAGALGGGVELDTSYTEGARFTLTIPIV